MNVSMVQSGIVEMLRNYFEREASRFGIEAAFLYGSWAVGFPRLESDIDIAVLFEDEGMSENEIFEQLNEITLNLIKILSSEVNVIPIRTDFRKPMLYYNVIVKGIAVFFKERWKFVRLINEALYHMEDFKTFGRRWQIDLVRRDLEQIKHV